MSNPTLARPPLQRQQTPGLFSQLAMAGWKPGLPDGMSAAVAEIDEDVCWRGHCPVCRAGALLYRPLHLGRRYKAVALCRHCGTATEF